MKTHFIKLVIFITSVFTSIFYVQTCIGKKNTSEPSSSWWNDKMHLLYFQGGINYYSKPLNTIYYEPGAQKIPAVNVMPPTTITSSDDLQAHLSAIYMPTDHFGINFSITTPFKFKKTFRDEKKQKKFDLTTSVTTPMLSMDYFPLASCSQWQPYIGLGVLMTHFSKFKAKAPGGKKTNTDKLKYEHRNVAGIVGEAGLNYKVDDNWSIGASMVNTRFNSKATLQEATDKFKDISAKWSLMAYRVNVGYHF